MIGNVDEELPLIGTAKALRKAMHVTKLSEMIDCFNDLKSFSGTIEKDLPNYFQHRPINQIIDVSDLPKDTTTDFIQMAKESASDRRYILLHDLIQATKRFNAIPSSKKKSGDVDYRSSSLENQVKIMKYVIAAQPSAREGIYLEALFNPDQWQANHQRLQSSTQEILTIKERQRLKELLNRSQ